MRLHARELWFEIHKYVGLSTFVFLTIAAATGSALVFRAGLDEALNPDLYRVAAAPTLSAAELARGFERSHPAIQVLTLPLTPRAGRTTMVEVGGRGGAHPAFDQMFLDPSDGRVVGARSNKAGWDRRHLMQGMFELHSGLIGGAAGRWIMGVAAGAWLLSNLVGFYLTLPKGGPFWRKWWSLWTVNPRAKLPRLLLDLHRASGLWLLPALTILALTSFSLNFYDEITAPIATALSPPMASPFDTASDPTSARRLDWARVVRRARADAAVRAPGWTPVNVVYDREHDLYGVKLTRSGRLDYAGLGPIALYYRASDDRFVYRDDPARDSAGRAVIRSLYPLHTGEVFGWTTRLLVFVLGLATAEMSVTGVYLWLKRRGARKAARARGS